MKWIVIGFIAFSFLLAWKTQLVLAGIIIVVCAERLIDHLIRWYKKKGR